MFLNKFFTLHLDYVYEFQGNSSVCFYSLICTKSGRIGHMQSMWDSNMTFSEFSDVDHPFDAEGNASVKSDCRFGLLLSASSVFCVIFPINVESCRLTSWMPNIPLKLEDKENI